MEQVKKRVKGKPSYNRMEISLCAWDRSGSVRHPVRITECGDYTVGAA